MPEHSEHFDNVRKTLDFCLDDKGEVWAVFINKDDQRRFPLKNLVIQAQLYSVVKDAAKPKEKLEALTFECVRHATQKYRTKSDRDDDVLEEDGLVCAILNRLARLKKAGHKPEWTGTVTQLIESLSNLPEEERFDFHEWPKGSKFAKHLRARTGVLAGLKVELTYKRVGTARNYTLKFVGKRADVKHVQVTEQDNLFEMLKLYDDDPKPIASNNPVTDGDAQKTKQASQSDDAGDAQEAKQASSPTVRKHVRERTGNTQEIPETSDQDPPEPAQV